MQSSRKGRKVIRSGPVPLGRDSEEKGDYTDRHPPWGVSGSSQTGLPSPGSYTGETSTLGLLEDHWDKQKGCGKPGLSSWGVLTHWLAPAAGQREVCSSGCQVSHDDLAMHPSPSWTNMPAPLTTHHNVALDLGQPQPGKDHGMHRRPGPRAEPGQGAVAIIGAYSSSLISDGSHSPSITCWESTWTLPALQSCSTTG